MTERIQQATTKPLGIYNVGALVPCRKPTLEYQQGTRLQSLALPDMEGAQLWLPDAPSIWTPKPPTVSSRKVVIDFETELLWESIKNLAYPADYETNPYWRSKRGHLFSVLRSLVCGQFVRRNLDKNFKGCKMARGWAKSLKQEIDYRADLMSKLWRTIKLLPLTPTPRPIIFHEINLEGALIFFDFFLDEEPQAPVTAVIKSQQNINRSLQSLKNPFDSNLTPATWSYVENCNQLAEQNEEFRVDYMEFVRARMRLTRSIKEHHPKRFDQSGVARENRGRKSIPSSRNRSG